MPVRRPWHPSTAAGLGARIFPVSAVRVSRRACAAGLVLAMATAGSLTGIITSNHRHGIAQAAAVPAALTTDDQLTDSSATSTAGDTALPSTTTAAAGLPVVASTAPVSQGHPGVIPVPLAPKAVAGPIPLLAWQAYHYAAAGSGCNLPWYVLAGIGKIESNHGRYGGAQFDITGTVHPAILGPPTAYGRAMGPMQFIPPTWASYAADGNGDGKADPQNVFDATKAAAHYLCRAGGPDLSSAAAQRRAVFAYNHLASYVADVLAFATAYRLGASESTVPIVPITYPKAKAKAGSAASHPASSARTTTTPSSTHPSGSSTSSAPTTSASTTAPPTTCTTSSAPSTPTSSATTKSTTTKSATTKSSATKSATTKSSATKSATTKTTAAATTAPAKTTTTATSTSTTANAPAATSPGAGSCPPCPAPTASSSRSTPSTTAPASPSCPAPTTSPTTSSARRSSATAKSSRP